VARRTRTKPAPEPIADAPDAPVTVEDPPQKPARTRRDPIDLGDDSMTVSVRIPREAKEVVDRICRDLMLDIANMLRLSLSWALPSLQSMAAQARAARNGEYYHSPAPFLPGMDRLHTFTPNGQHHQPVPAPTPGPAPENGQAEE
jgi:hypothetical protein